MEQIQIQELTQEQIQAILQTPLEIMNYKTKTLDKILTIIEHTKSDDELRKMDVEIYRHSMLMEALFNYANLERQQAKIRRQQAKMRRQQSEIDLKRERRLLKEEMLKLTENIQNDKGIVNIILSKVP